MAGHHRLRAADVSFGPDAEVTACPDHTRRLTRAIYVTSAAAVKESHFG